MKWNRERMACWMALGLLVSAGCRHGMEDQPKLQPMTSSDFFEDGRSARMPVEGTVAQGHLDDDELFFAGKINGRDADLFPIPVTRGVLERGRERYDIYCAICHDRLGTGDGMAVRRGFPRPPSFHTDRLRRAPAGHFFDVITHGFGAMYSYDNRVPARDRWAIIAYIRTLQLSQHAAEADVPLKERGKLQ